MVTKEIKSRFTLPRTIVVSMKPRKRGGQGLSVPTSVSSSLLKRACKSSPPVRKVQRLIKTRRRMYSGSFSIFSSSMISCSHLEKIGSASASREASTATTGSASRIPRI